MAPSHGRVLIIEDDEWESTLLARVLREAHFEVHVAATAKDGLAQALALAPDCIVCDMMLPDLDGTWVARKIRTDAGRVASTPFVFLTAADDKETKLQGFNVGADIYITKPYGIEEIVAQVRALIELAKRMSVQRDSYGPASSSLPPAVRGDIAQMELSTVLTIFDMERRTGRLKVRTDGGKTATFELVDGAVLRSTLDSAPREHVAVLREVLDWKRGRFWFRPGPIRRGTTPTMPIGPLLLEAMRLKDESKR